MKRSKRAAAIGVDEVLLEDILRIPKGIRIHGMWQDPMRRLWLLRIEPVPGAGWEACFPEIHEGESLPIIYLEMSDETPGAILEVRFRWWFVTRCKLAWAKVKGWFNAKVQSLWRRDPVHNDGIGEEKPGEPRPDAGMERDDG